ncbi:MAG: hypothetical protein LC101_08565, partial [Flavobacteriales bacterium]|nr:hypothetical protein [Flavobacteriales bacterium]
VTANLVNYACGVVNNQTKIGEEILPAYAMAKVIGENLSGQRTPTEAITKAFAAFKVENSFSLTCKAERLWRKELMAVIGVWLNVFPKGVPNEKLMLEMLKWSIRRIANCRQGVGELWRAQNEDGTRSETTNKDKALSQASEYRQSRNEFSSNSKKLNDDIPF